MRSHLNKTLLLDTCMLQVDPDQSDVGQHFIKLTLIHNQDQYDPNQCDAG